MIFIFCNYKLSDEFDEESDEVEGDKSDGHLEDFLSVLPPVSSFCDDAFLFEGCCES